MKKSFILIILFSISLINCFSEECIAFSEEFNLILEAMDISKQNKDGLYLNEDIYKAYSLFVYGTPIEITSGQRWKNVTDGNWTKGSGIWKGIGIRGEYWILGKNYHGKDVHNHKFPVDIEPPTKPTEWRYAVIPDALDSWQETEKYMDDIQREYMISQKLMRNDIFYDMTVQDIGFEKARLENYATWKTKGTIYTQRYDMNNKKWAANFMVPPMAGDADLEGYAKFPNGTQYDIEEPTDINIPIIYGCDVINLTEYAKAEHVKEIKSQLYINGEFIDEISTSKNTSVEKNYIHMIDKDEYEEGKLLKLDVQIKSTLFTTFSTDGVMADIKEYTIFINFGRYKEDDSFYNNVGDYTYVEYPDFPPPEITSIEIKRVVDNQELPLLISRKTEKEFICAGQTIYLKIEAINGAEDVTIEFEGDSSINKFDELTKRFEWEEPKRRNQKTLFRTLKEFEKMYKKKIYTKQNEKNSEQFKCTYVIPYGTKQTLHSWSTLRQKSNNAFDIDEGKLFSRITKPYEIVLKASGPTRSYN